MRRWILQALGVALISGTAAAQDGKVLYETYCGACHAPDGKGMNNGQFPPLAGSELTFTKPVDPKTAGNKDSYKMAAWTYIYQKDYGSPEVDQAVPVIKDVVVGGDGMSVRLVIDGLVKGHVHHLNSAGLRSKGGEELWHADGYYTLNEIPE
tara:strand:- start:2 stop:457 length:456 start_codon:yes stop_codon:yes gene_type:complete